MPAPDSVLSRLEASFDDALAELVELARIPSVSAAGFDATQVKRSADAVARLFERIGLAPVDILEVGDAHPAVVGEWKGAGAKAPTVLLYAHHDVQPPGRLDRWESPPFEPVVREDGRLYGRGVVDDKAGILVHVAALRAWLEATGSLPVNVVFLAEGEEETGSQNLEAFLRKHRGRLEADVIVLSDTTNLERGLPSITTSLRGLVVVDVHVRALERPVHSGIWGGPVPDAATALGSLLGRLVDARGNVLIPGFEDDVPALTPAERAALAVLPFEASRFRREAGMFGDTPFAGDSGRSVYERIWRAPSLAVTALEAVPLAEAANQLISEARARVGVRLAPGQDPNRMRDRLCDFLHRDPPLGVRVETEVESCVGGWQTDPVGPAFDAASRALEAGFGRAPVFIGCGGSIPFVGPFAEVLGGVPALLLGLEDPVCNAHGENESLDLRDFRCAARSATHLLAELAATAAAHGGFRTLER